MKTEILEKAVENYIECYDRQGRIKAKRHFIAGAKWQLERSYSEEELLEILASYADWSTNGDCTYYEWFEQFKKK